MQTQRCLAPLEVGGGRVAGMRSLGDIRTSLVCLRAAAHAVEITGEQHGEVLQN